MSATGSYPDSDYGYLMSGGCARASPELPPDVLAQTTTCGPDYETPAWFLEHNIRTTSDLLDVGSQLSLFDNDKCEQDDQDPVAAGSHDVEEQNDETGNSGDDTLGGSKESCPHHITHDTYLELRDVVAASLASADGGESAHKQCAINLDIGYRDCSGLVDTILVHLAKELSAHIISFDLDDLEDLAEDFERQQQLFDSANSDQENGDAVPERKQPDRKAAYSHVECFFGSKRNSSRQERQLTVAAISAILDGPDRKNRPESLQDMPDHASHDTEVPTFVVFNRAPDLMDVRRESVPRILARFRDQIQKRRAESGKFCMFTVTPDNPSMGHAPRERFVGGSKYLRWQLLERLQIDEASTVKIHQTAPSPATVVQGNSIRLFKRALRREITVKDESKLLVPHSKWLDEDSHHTMHGMQTTWDLQDVQRAVRQIQGRTAGKDVLELQDIFAVLQRIDRRKESAKANTSTDKGSGNKPDGEFADDSDELNKYEELVLECRVDTTKLSTTFEDVIMDEDTKQTVIQLLKLSFIRTEGASMELLKHIRMNGALFYGPPGTGKTHLARAIASTTGASMLSIDAARIQNKYLGESEKMIKAAFTLATKLSPCILFIDEADALFYRRSSHDKSWERSTLTQFLTQMDGLISTIEPRKPFVIAATNRPKDLDEAFMRRLPHKVLFSLPDESARAQILRIYLKKDDLKDDVDIDWLAESTTGFSGSDLLNLCEEAALAWAMDQKIANKSFAEIMSASKTHGDTLAVKLKLGSEHFQKALRKTQLHKEKSSRHY